MSGFQLQNDNVWAAFFEAEMTAITNHMLQSIRNNLYYGPTCCDCHQTAGPCPGADPDEAPTWPGGHHAPAQTSFNWPDPPSYPATDWVTPAKVPEAVMEEGPKECDQCHRPRPYKDEKTGRWTCWCCGKVLT